MSMRYFYQKYFFAFTLLASGLALPILATAQTTPPATDPQPTANGFLREGVFGCSAGRYPLDVAALQAVQGVYVPVNDAAVTLNTGFLVYKECVLDGVVAATREAATGAIVRSILTAANRGRNGSPQYVTQPGKEAIQRADTAYLEFVKEHNIKDICSPYQQRVKFAVANTYYQETRDPNNSFRCTIKPEEIAAMNRGEFRGWDNWTELLNPANNALGAAVLAEMEASSRAQKDVGDLFTQIDWSGGWYPREEQVCTPTASGDTQCEWKTLTPGRIVATIIDQAVTSGYRQLENALLDSEDNVVTGNRKHIERLLAGGLDPSVRARRNHDDSNLRQRSWAYKGCMRRGRVQQMAGM